MKIWFAQNNDDGRTIHTDLILNIDSKGEVTIEFIRESCLFVERVQQ